MHSLRWLSSWDWASQFFFPYWQFLIPTFLIALQGWDQSPETSLLWYCASSSSDRELTIALERARGGKAITTALDWKTSDLVRGRAAALTWAAGTQAGAPVFLARWSEQHHWGDWRPRLGAALSLCCVHGPAQTYATKAQFSQRYLLRGRATAGAVPATASEIGRDRQLLATTARSFLVPY